MDKDSSAIKQQIVNWLILKLVPRLAIDKKLALVEQFGIERLVHQPPTRELLSLSAKQYQALIHPDKAKIEQIIAAATACDAKILTYDHPDYPQLVKQLFDPPLVLFVKGNSRLLNSSQLAIVGSRNCTIGGKDNAKHFAKAAINNGLLVTSGLALGVDAAAHSAVIEMSAPTIAVIATGIEQIYPKRHVFLAKALLAKGGAIVTEFLPGIPAKAGHFPKRNRLISGMSEGVLVVEATEKSGSLITARCALEQNREVFAIPSSINNPQAKGCHQLIKQGAKLVENIEDIVEELAINAKYELNLNKIKHKENASKKSCLQGLCNDPLLASVGYEITPVDKVVSRSKLPIDVVLTRLTMLELRGLVTAVPGGYLKIK